MDLQEEVAQLQREVSAALESGSPMGRRVPTRTPPRRGSAQTGGSPRRRPSSKGTPAAAAAVAAVAAGAAPAGVTRSDPSAQAFTPREAELLAELQAQRQACREARAALKAEKSAAKQARAEAAKCKKRAARTTEQLDALRVAFEAEQASSTQLRTQLDALTRQVEAEYGKLEGHQQTVQTLKERMDAMKVSTAPLLGVNIAWASESPAAVRVRAVESAMKQQIRHMQRKIAALEDSLALVRSQEAHSVARPLANAKVLQHQMHQIEQKIAALEMPPILDYEASELASEAQPALQPALQPTSQREDSAAVHQSKSDPSRRPVETVSSLRISPSARAAAKAAQVASDRAVVNKELDRYACRSASL